MKYVDPHQQDKRKPHDLHIPGLVGLLGTFAGFFGRVLRVPTPPVHPGF